jgi:hypothetical protein
MKIRNGFVSNSSSSSFVIIGCELTETELKAFKEKLVGRARAGDDDWNWDDESCDALRKNKWMCDEERSKPLLGRVLAEQDGDDYILPEEDYTFEQIREIMKKVKKELHKEPKLFTGMRAC